ncbi:MAG: hypothetical protein AAGA28_10315 [Pseudomonadota bacterium]
MCGVPRLGARRWLVCALVLAFTAEAGAAPQLSDCTRTTHVSHGGEDLHRDLGAGRVMWREWWSQEGTATDYVIVDCGPGLGLRFRTAEDNMSARAPFDRTNAALSIVESHERGARVFATLDRIAADLDARARDVALFELTGEPCACAALYPALRGARPAFEMKKG